MYPKIAQFKNADGLRARLAELGLEIPLDPRILTAAESSPLAQPFRFGDFQVGNRWCIHPMEGWDGELDGAPSELTLRRWRHFGLSGAKLIWGGEAAAVQADGRANPRQLLATGDHRAGLQALADTLREAHQNQFGTADDLLLGLQLTHSGRFSRPRGSRLEPRIAYRHPLLDERFGLSTTDEAVVWSDDDLERLVDRYVESSQVALEAGFQFVDIKACHGYLLHEFLSAARRPGRFGGDFAGRTRLLLTIVKRVRQESPQLMIGVRLSAFDTVPYRAARSDGAGEPTPYSHLIPYDCGFGLDARNPLAMDLAEPLRLLDELQQAGVAAVSISCGSPYYAPHIQRPALFPPSDGYPPPEDPLVGVARQIQATRRCKAHAPGMAVVGAGYSYLQDYLPQVAQAVARLGWADAVGMGRMVLSYPEMPADSLRLGRLARKKVCRTLSDCTTAPRQGLVSGCYPLDPYYKTMPEAAELQDHKAKSLRRDPK